MLLACKVNEYWCGFYPNNYDKTNKNRINK